MRNFSRVQLGRAYIIVLQFVTIHFLKGENVIFGAEENLRFATDAS